MTYRAKVWLSGAVAVVVTALAAMIVTVNVGVMLYALLVFAWQSLYMTGFWLRDRYKRIRARSALILWVASFIGAQGALAAILLGRGWVLPDPTLGEMFGGAVPVGIAWAVAALLAFRPFIKSPGAPPSLRWRDLTAPRPQS